MPKKERSLRNWLEFKINDRNDLLNSEGNIDDYENYKYLENDDNISEYEFLDEEFL